jgi:phage head maturation protease
VLDGTLSGLSIGGRLKETRNIFDEEINKMVRVIDDYEMVELSLVDTPANPLANVTIVQKVDGVMESMTLKGELETIYMCSEDKVVKVSKEESIECPVCRTDMHDIGFV